MAMSNTGVPLEKLPFILIDNNVLYIGGGGIGDCKVKVNNLLTPNPSERWFEVTPSIYGTEITISATLQDGKFTRIPSDTETERLITEIKKYLSENYKTSEEWSKLYAFKILDPDGWDRRDFDYSWREELISREEFHCRAMRSTIEMRTWMDEHD